uniref:Cation efflux protein cytoplasmic domain-containing protein n=1 Tax=Glossina brevipalpis TaxID=37001 RepID=A0A1A9WDJ6_9MUSC
MPTETVGTQKSLFSLRGISMMVLHGSRPPEIFSNRTTPPQQEEDLIDLRVYRKIKISFVLCVLLMIGELIGAILSNSLALALDATHQLVNFATFLIGLFAVWITKRPSSEQLNYGWHRIEVICAMYTILFVWFITASLVYLGVKRILNGGYEINATVMLIVSGIAIVINLMMGFQIRTNIDEKIVKLFARKKRYVSPNKRALCYAHAAMYDHGNVNKSVQTSDIKLKGGPGSSDIQQHPYRLINVPSKIINLDKKVLDNKHYTLRVAIIHIMADIIHSLGVFIVGWIIYTQPTWVIADPILTFIFAILVAASTFIVIRDALFVLMETTPTYLDFQEIHNALLSIEGVRSVHNLRIWALSMNKVACVAHVQIVEGADPQLILRQARLQIHRRYSFFETTIQIEET